MGIEGTYLNIVKARYDKSTASIILNGKKLQAFPLRLGTTQECLLSPLFFNIILEGLATAISQEEGIPKDKPTKEVKVLYLENYRTWKKEIE